MEHLEDDLGLPRKYSDNSTAKAAGRQGADSGTGINRLHSQPGVDTCTTIVHRVDTAEQARSGSRPTTWPPIVRQLGCSVESPDA